MERVEEVREAVQFETMNLVDQLLMMNTGAKKESLERIRKHKHVIFSDEPVVIEFENYIYMPAAPEPEPS